MKSKKTNSDYELYNSITTMILESTAKLDVISVKQLSKILDAFNECYGTKDYTKNFYESFSVEDKFLCAYNYHDKAVLINHAKLIDFLNSMISKEAEFGLDNDEYTKLFKLNTDIVCTFLHELYHAYQFKYCLEKEDDLYKQILELSMRSNLELIKNYDRFEYLDSKTLRFIEYSNELYNLPHSMYYKYSPHERMAKIDALRIVKSAIKEELNQSTNHDVYSKMINYYELKYLVALIDGYEEIGGPTANFANTQKNLLDGGRYGRGNIFPDKFVKEYKQIAKENKCDIENKAYYGLPLSKLAIFNFQKKIDRQSFYVRALHRHK